MIVNGMTEAIVTLYTNMPTFVSLSIPKPVPMFNDRGLLLMFARKQPIYSEIHLPVVFTIRGPLPIHDLRLIALKTT